MRGTDRHDHPAVAASPDGVLPPVPGVSGLVPLAGAVSRGVSDRTGAPVAVKVLSHPFDRDTRDQFDADRTRLGRLRHVPSILQIDDADALADGRPYLVTELCADSVDGLLDRGERLNGEEVAAVGSAAASALAAAHRAGVVHGRVTPANLLVRASGQPVLSDFGPAVRQAGPADIDEYAAPETLRDGTVTVRSDLYGLGATLYAALTGRPPFPVRVGEHPAERVLRVLRQAPPPVDPGLAPPELVALLAQLVATDPADRPADAARVAGRFDAMLTARVLPAVAEPRAVRPPEAPAGPAGSSDSVVGVGRPGSAAPDGPAAGRVVAGPGTAAEAVRADLPGPDGRLDPRRGSESASLGRPAESAALPAPGMPAGAAGPAGPAGPDGTARSPEAGPAGVGPVGLGSVGVGSAGEPGRSVRREPPARRLVLVGKVAAGVALAVVGVLLTRQIGTGPTLAAAPSAEPSSAAVPDRDPAEATVRLTAVRVVDRGRKVTLAWQGPPGMSYAVIVAAAGRPSPAAKLVNQQRTRTFVIEPGRQYCFQVQGSFDGVRAVQSAPKGINGATCEG